MPNPDRFFETFKARVKLATEAEATQRQHEVADLRFEAGEHWTAQEVRDRNLASKPSMTIDLLSGPIKQVTNQQRTARPGITVSPVGNGADVKKAENWMGVFRRMERLSKAHRAYCWAGQFQTTMGRGFWVYRNIEIGDDGEQDVRVEAVENQHSILCDPNPKRLDGLDKRWAIRFEDLTHEEYIDRFGETTLAGRLGEAFTAGMGDAVPQWITTTHTRIAEYYYLEETPRTRLILSNGSRVWADELPTVKGRAKGKFATVPQLPDGVTVVRTVKKPKTTVQWRLLNGVGEVLDEARIPGKYIPVVMVHGERRFVEGQRDFRGMVRMNKEPCRMEDWAESSLMEAISHAKTAPWLLAVGQAEGLAHVWDHSNVNPPQALYYHPINVDGHVVPPPIRVPAGVDVSALTLAAQRMQNHVRNTTGQADTYQDETGGQQAKLSGRAIAFRRQNQELTTSDYMENLGDGIACGAEIAFWMYREILDTPRLLRILDAEEKERPILVARGDANPQDIARVKAQEAEVADMLDPTVGDYDITFTAGRSHATARQEGSEMMQGLPPEILMPIADIYVGNQDFPGSQEAAKRLKKANPLAQDETQQQAPVPPQIQQRLVQLDQFAQAATETITTLQQQLDQKKTELDSKERIEAAKLAATREIEAAKLDLARLQLELERFKIEADLHKVEMQQQAAKHAQREGYAHELGLAGMGAVRDDDAAATAHQRSLETSDRSHAQALEQQAARPEPSPTNGATA